MPTQHLAAVFSHSGSIVQGHSPAANATKATFLSSQTPAPTHLVKSQKPEPAAIPASILSTAALALSGGRVTASRQASQQARRDVDKALQQPPWMAAGADVSGPIGAVLQLVARAFTAVGIIMQRLAVHDDEMRLLWRVWMCTLIVAYVPDALSYFLTPQPVLTAATCLESLLVPVLSASLLPRDGASLSSVYFLATLVCVAGIIGCVALSPSRAAAIGIWEKNQDVEQLYLPSGVHRLTMYAIVILPVAIYHALKIRSHKAMMIRGMPEVSCLQDSHGRVCCLSHALVAAIALALQRLTLGMLDFSLRSFLWQPQFIFWSSNIFVLAGVVLVCTSAACYYICQGVMELPPHTFVPIYCTISVLLQVFQSTVVARDNSGESAERVVLILACASIAILGICQLLTLPKQIPPTTDREVEVSWLSKFGRRGNTLLGSEEHDVNCLAPVPLNPTTVDAVPST